MHTSNTQPPKRDNKRDFITTAVQSAMAAEATTQAMCACQVGGFSTIRVFYIACKRSC